MTKKILLINGPNLNLLGMRQPEIYGSETLQDLENACVARAKKNNMTLEAFQSNSEGAIVEKIHNARGKMDAIIINPGAYSHTSIAIMDAIIGAEVPVHEVHISNIHAREDFRHNSYVSKVAKSIICGQGTKGYLSAIDFIAGV